MGRNGGRYVPEAARLLGRTDSSTAHVQAGLSLDVASCPGPRFCSLAAPNCTIPSRRSEERKVPLPVTSGGKAMRLVVDSTSTKFHDEGEWWVRKQGFSKRLTWRGPSRNGRERSVERNADCAWAADDASIWPGLLAPKSSPENPRTIGGDGAYEITHLLGVCSATIVEITLKQRDYVRFPKYVHSGR